jgi:putative ATP-dependent endonuclease of the OLD family
MRVARLKISGFRGIRSGDVVLGAHSVLVGPNNVGKTAIIEALALLLGRDRLVRNLTEHDFFGSAPDNASRIVIVATVTDFPSENPQDHREWFGVERGVEKWLDLQTGTLHPVQTSPDLKLAVQIAVAARFDIDTLEAELIRFFVDDDSAIGDPFDENSHTRVVRGSTLRELGFFLVSATRTWDRWISFSSELFRRVIGTIGGVPAAAVRAERDRLRAPHDPLENSAGLTGIVASINEELRHLFSRAPHLQLRLTSTDSEGVMQAVVPHFFHGTGPSLPASRVSDVRFVCHNARPSAPSTIACAVL